MLFFVEPKTIDTILAAWAIRRGSARPTSFPVVLSLQSTTVTTLTSGPSALFFAAAEFDFVAPLEARWRDVLAEYEALPRELFMTWPEPELEAGDGWQVYGLYAFGEKLEANCARCPTTTRLVEAIPGVATAGFSVLLPGTRIRPHVGYTNTVLRCHLGLVIPEGCALKVGDQTRSWQPGRCLVFDDTTLHSAWNAAERERAVLIVDVKRPELEFESGVSAEIAEIARRVAGGKD